MTLKIAVLVKQVPDHEALVRIKSEDELEIENRYVCSFFDEVAMEAALELAKAHPGAELWALSAGGRRATDALRRAVAMGIDQVEQLGDQSLEGADSNAVARVLAARLQQLSPQLILCGKQAGDDDQGAVGPMVAEALGIPHASAVVSLELDPAAEKATAARQVEGELWTVCSGLPLLVTAQKGLAEPHIPVVTRVMKAMRAAITTHSLADLGLGELRPAVHFRRLRYCPPPTRPPVTMMEQPFPDCVPELLEHLQQRGVLAEKGGAP